MRDSQSAIKFIVGTFPLRGEDEKSRANCFPLRRSIQDFSLSLSSGLMRMRDVNECIHGAAFKPDGSLQHRSPRGRERDFLRHRVVLVTSRGLEEDGEKKGESGRKREREAALSCIYTSSRSRLRETRAFPSRPGIDASREDAEERRRSEGLRLRRGPLDLLRPHC